MTGRVLITGARAPAALDLARGFAAAGYEVHLADSRSSLMARWSGLAAGLHRYGSPTLEPEAFLRDIDGLVRALDPALIVPVCEEVFHLASAGQASGWAQRLFAPSTGVLDRLHSKFRFIELSGALDLPAPTTRRITDRAELAEVAGDGSRSVFKAEYSRFGAGVLVGPSPARLAKIDPTPARPWVMQDRIIGREACFYAVALEGRLTAFSAYESAWRLSGGAGYAFAPLKTLMRDRLSIMAERLAGFVGTGQFACDLIIDADDRPWLIECNPRATSGVHLFGGGRGLADAMMGRTTQVALGEEGGCLGPAMWRYGLPTALGTGRLAAWRAERRRGQDVIGRGDRGAAIGAVFDSAAFSLQALLADQSLEQAMTADIEWNGPGGGS